MGKETLIIFFGVWVAIQSFLGFPLRWDEVTLAVLGIAIAVLGILRYREMAAHRTPQRTQTFVENAPQAEASEAAADPHAREIGAVGYAD